MEPERTDNQSVMVEPTSVVGRFEWDTVADSWWWSDGLYRIYGYQPDEVEATLERFVNHKDPRDLARIDAVFNRCLSQGGPFSCYHRIVDATGRRKTVVVVGFGDRDADDTKTVSMHGFMVDVTASGREETNAALQAALQTRSVIEQVKGAIMLVHGLSADAAFDVLRGHSQIYNKKLSALAANAVVAIEQRGDSETVSRAEVDQILFDAAQQE